MRSPVQRTLRALREAGHSHVETVERWVTIPKHPAGGVRKDFLGIFDLMVVDNNALIAIQVSGVRKEAEHIKKMMQTEELGLWLRGPGRHAQLWGWRKVRRQTSSGNRLVWAPRIFIFSLDENENPIVTELPTEQAETAMAGIRLWASPQEPQKGEGRTFEEPELPIF